MEEESYLFFCPSHTKEIKDVTYRVKASKAELDESQFFGGEISTVEARRKISWNANVKAMSGSSYIQYDGFIYHISRFLSLQAGKAYCHSSSRQERWRSHAFMTSLVKYMSRVSNSTLVSLLDTTMTTFSEKLNVSQKSLG